MSLLQIKNEVLMRLYLVAIGVLLFAFVLWGRMYQLAVRQAAKWENKADSLHMKWVDVYADRGNILARDGSLLATSLPFFDVYFDAKAEGLTDAAFEENLDSLSFLLSTEIDPQYTPGEYRNWLVKLRKANLNTRGIRYIPIAKNVGFDQAAAIRNFPLFRLGRYKGGLIMEQKPRRVRPFNMLAQRTIGYQRRGALPVGIEGSFDHILGGNLGKQLRLKVPGDIYIPVNDLAEIEPKAGNDVVTTLDVNIQDATENALLDALKTHDADHGCAIVMEVATGAIRAIANIGKTGGEWQETYNYAIGERVEPGSMFKLASFLALLEDGHLDNLNQSVAVYKGKANIHGVELSDAELHGLDFMTATQVFARSSNIGTTQLILKHYRQDQGSRFVKRLKSFGLDQKTGIEIGGEDPPLLKDPDNPNSGWSGTTLPWMSIGYELLLTPLQLLTFYNTVANDGFIAKPYLVDRIEKNGIIQKQFKPQISDRRIASLHALEQARKLLQAVVTSGTATALKNDSYPIAGKTGTTQLGYHKWNTRSGIRYQAGFAGFFPADKPIYACIVVVSEPKKGGYHGAEVAAPVFKAIADKCFTMESALHEALNRGPKNSPKNHTLPSSQKGSVADLKKAAERLELPISDRTSMQEKTTARVQWAVLHPEDNQLVLSELNFPGNKLPSVIGMGLKDALFLIENRGCRVRVKGVGKVVSQTPEPGTPCNSTVTCYLQLN
jgi:cell division protein FtsI (penicillin-binding protein 3)